MKPLAQFSIDFRVMAVAGGLVPEPAMVSNEKHAGGVFSGRNRIRARRALNCGGGRGSGFPRRNRGR